MVRRKEPGDQGRQENVGRLVGERQELEWRVREERTADTRGHRETALDGYIKVGENILFLNYILQNFKSHLHTTKINI